MLSDWFRAFMEAAPDVYFRYAFAPARRFAYVSRAVRTLAGHGPEEFYADPGLCVSLVHREDWHALRTIVRSRRGATTALRLQRPDGAIVPVEVRTVPVIRGRKVIAVEGVVSACGRPVLAGSGIPSEPVQQRLAALLYEVHDLLHGALPARAGETAGAPRTSETTLQIGDIAIDGERMVVTLAGAVIPLTTRELLVLKYFFQHQARLVTRQQLLTEVWGYRYTGDHRTVDVHVSRLRQKLPPLRDMLRAVRHLGYRLDRSDTRSAGDRRVAKT